MRTGMKRLFAAFAAGMLLFSTAFAQEDQELTEEDLFAQWDLEADETENVVLDENGEEHQVLSDAELAELDTLEDMGEVVIDESQLEINENLPDHVVNILLLGIDNRQDVTEGGRSDAMLICSINTQDGSIKLTSIARDTAVEVPGYKSKKRLNTAFKFGSKDGDIAKGAELAMKTVNRNFQMNIERYVVVNIHGLADIIEALGGVDMELTKGEAQAINYELHVKEPMDDVQRDKLEVADGVQHLDGMEAVTYGRIRNLQGQNDLNRNERQRKLLEALLKKVMEDMDITKFLNLIETALPYGKTNLTADELLSLGMTVLSGSAMQNLASGGEVVGQFGIPMEKQYGYREFNGESLVYISDKRMQTTLTAMQEFIYGQSYVK